MTRWRWLALGPGRPVRHLVSEHKPVTASEARWDTACGSTEALLVVVEPDGDERCILCHRRVLGT